MKILIADDHMLYREGLASFLRKVEKNIEIIEAENYTEAENILSKEKDIDLFIMDLDMPDASIEKGFSMISPYIKKEEIKLIVMSAFEDVSVVRKTFDWGVDGFIPKSIDPRVLESAIRLVLSGGVYLPSDVLQKYISTTTNKETREKGKLTGRQKEVLGFIAKGLSNKQIAYELDITESTIKLHINSILKILGVTNRTAAVLKAQELRLI